MVIIRQFYQDFGGKRNYAGFILGVCVLGYVKIFGDIFLSNIVILSYSSQVFELHNNHPFFYYAISVIKILTFICNTDIIVLSKIDENIKGASGYEILSKMWKRDC